MHSSTHELCEAKYHIKGIYCSLILYYIFLFTHLTNICNSFHLKFWYSYHSNFYTIMSCGFSGFIALHFIVIRASTLRKQVKKLVLLISSVALFKTSWNFILRCWEKEKDYSTKSMQDTVVLQLLPFLTNKLVPL